MRNIAVVFLLLGLLVVGSKASYGESVPDESQQTVEVQSASCKHMFAWASADPSTPDEFKAQYDTLRLYIESCYQDTDSWRVFGPMSAAVFRYSTDTTRYWTYRNWLLSVLNLNTTEPKYFCECLHSIAGTYQYDHISNAYLAVLYYLTHTPSCNGLGYQEDYNGGVWARHLNWMEGDQSVPEDTTLPSLDKLGLGFLLTRGVPTPASPMTSTYLTSFSGSPNPFVAETDLTFTLNRMTYVTVAVYDQLGRMVWGDGKGRSLDAGAHTIHIDGSSLPNGTLYARISTGFGEVKTVKLVKNQ